MLWLWILLGVLAFLAFTTFLAASSLFGILAIKPRFTFNRSPLSKHDKKLFMDATLKAEEWLSTVKSEEITITNGKIRLHGVFLNQKSDRSVIIVHGYAAELRYRLLDAPFWYNKGFNVLLIDLRTHGKSSGKYVTMGIWEAKDLVKWTQWLSRYTGGSRIILDGTSMGAATVLNATAMKLPPNVVGVVADCGYTTMRDVAHHLFRRYALMPGWLVIGLGEGFARCFGKFSLYRDGPIYSVRKATIPALFIHGTNDKFVPTWMVDKLYENYAGPKKLLKIQGAGHAMSSCYDRPKYQKAIEKLIDIAMPYD